MIGDNLKDLVSECSISTDKLILEATLRDSVQSIPFIDKSIKYNPFTTSNINSMSTYNALRYLYRKAYDLRSQGRVADNDKDKIVGREIHPLKNIEMPINFINDFSISARFKTSTDNDFVMSICEILPKASFAFRDSNVHCNMNIDRQNKFVQDESNQDKLQSNNFFSYSADITPLLYSFGYIDPNDRKFKYMDADLFLELGLYDSIFNKESFLMKGNQYCIPLWLGVTNTTSQTKELYDDEGYVSGYEMEFENEHLLLKDSYTKDFIEVLQNGSKYYQLNAQTDYIEKCETPISEEDTRGHLLYDDLLELVLKKVKDFIIEDKNSTKDCDKNFILLSKMIKSEAIRNSSELDSISIDQYFALNSYSNQDINNKEMMDKFKEQLGEYLTSVYQYSYEVVFGKLFRILPFIFSPAYKFHIQSPAMNIMYMAFSIMVIKHSYYHNKEDYDSIINNLYQIDINSLTKHDLYNLFDRVFKKDTLTRNLDKHLKNVLPILIKNSTYIDDIESHEHVETDDNEETLLSKSVILLTEFFTKCENLRYFDASTFCIDYTDLKDVEKRRSLKLFSDSLMEACYIHMNILGSEIFFNGKAPSHTNSNGIDNSLLNNNKYEDLLGLDITRVAKQNVSLINNWSKEDNQYLINSYHSYLAVINLYTSLVYSIQITIDNLSINNYLTAPYRTSNIRRPQSLWTIFKRYAIHLTYMNNNSYGIWNDVKISSNNKSEIQRMMVSQRIKWLTYGLHLRVWFNDAYMFYTNYKKLAIDMNGDIISALKETLRLSEEFVENGKEQLQLFISNWNKPIIPMPNVNLMLYPMAGSYTITANAACLDYFTNSKEVIVNLIHYGLKDIMVGDSMSSVIDERLECVKNLITNSKLSFNNINGMLQNIFDSLGTSSYHELAISMNLNFLYKNVIKPYFISNPNDCLLLNNSSSTLTYDKQFFDNEDNVCSYQIAYESSWSYRILNALLNSSYDKSNYIKLVGKILNLYILTCSNFKAWHASSDNDKLITKYYNKYYGLSNMISIFIKDNLNGIKKAFDDKQKYGIFNKIIQSIFTGNTVNNQYRIANILSNSYAKFSFEDCIVNNTPGGTIYGMYESPSMLMLYNNIDFGSGYIEPSNEQLYMLSRDLFGRIYSTMKRLFVDLSYDGDPIESIIKFKNYSIDEAQVQFINDSIDQFYIVTNNTSYNDSIHAMFKSINDSNELYTFATIFGQFMDYDYIASQVIKLLTDRQYSLTDKQDIIKFLNNMISNRGQDINKYNAYCLKIDKIDNQLNYLINVMISSKRGSLVKSEKLPDLSNKTDKSNCSDLYTSLNKRDDIKVSTNSNYPVKIDDNSNLTIDCISDSNLLQLYISYEYIGITKDELDKFIELSSDESKKIVDSSDIDYDKEIAELEIKLSQLRRLKNIKEGRTTEDNLTSSEKELYTLASQGKDILTILFDKLAQLDNKVSNMKEVILDTNYMVKQILIPNSKDECTDVVTKDKEVYAQTIESQVFINKLDDYNNIYSQPLDLEKAYLSPIKPYKNSDGNLVIENHYGEKCTIVKDLRDDNLITVDNKCISNESSAIPNDAELNAPYRVIDKYRHSYNKLFYIPLEYLINYIPLSTDSNQVSLKKAIDQEIPIYTLDKYNLMIVIDNIPISFNQCLDFIKKDIEERISIVNFELGKKILEKLNSGFLDNWDDDSITLLTRINIVEAFHSWCKSIEKIGAI